MTAEDFDRFLRGELCWLDGVPTSASHAGQRQCPHCRRKWSYARLRRRWILAIEFARESSRRSAAKVAGTDVHTAGKVYREISDAMSAYIVERLRRSEGGFDADPKRLADAYARMLRTPEQAKRLRLVTELGLADLSAERRLELIYRLVFRERVQKLIRSGLSAALKRGDWTSEILD